jgi:hypothetical protein
MYGKKFKFIFLVIIVSFFCLITYTQNIFAYADLAEINESKSKIIPINNLIAQQDFDTVEIKTIPVRDNIYMLIGDGGNIGVSVGEDGILLIDSQFAPLTEKIQQSIQKINQKQINYFDNYLSRFTDKLS